MKKRIAPAQDKLEAVGIEEICARIANCEFIHEIAASIGVSAAALHAYLDKHPEMYTRARERQADKHAEDILAIADDGSNDTYVDENGNKRTDQEVVARSRLRVEARKWLASKMRPKVYGEKLAIDADIRTSDMTDAQLIERAKVLADKLGLSIDIDSLKIIGGDTAKPALENKK